MKLYMTTAKVLRALLEDPEVPRYGLEMTRATGVTSGALYPVLRRLQAEGLVTAEQEQIDPSVQERPARCYYRLTPDGLRFAVRELESLSARLRPPPRALRALAS